MRKRAQRRSKAYSEQPQHIIQKFKPKEEIKSIKAKRKWWIAISLVSIFLLVLFFNTYFNLTSNVSINPEGEGLAKFYLSGPDPYYNMRLIQGTYTTGEYPYYSDFDPLLKYPTGARGGRAPLFNMMAIGFSRVLVPFMSEIDALGYSMQFIPALFGAILIFPVYFIGKELFNKKAALIGAFFIAIIPIHLGSGHGSAYALFDHDSFNLLLFFLTYCFLLKAIKEKNSTKSLLFAILGGIPLAGLTMTWVEARYLYVVIAIYIIVQMIIDIFTDKIEFRLFRTSAVLLFTGYLISIPVIYTKEGFSIDIPLFLSAAVAAFGFIYYMFNRRKIPWTISLPSVFSLAAVALIFLYFIEPIRKAISLLSPLEKLREVIFGTGIYGQKVSMTIAEANTYEISHTVMSFGPSIYWLAWAGFFFLLYSYYKNKHRKDYLFLIVLFLVNIWLAGTAGRFLNDNVPLIAILSGWIIWIFIDWIDYKQMIRNIKSAGGGFHGIRRGVKFLHIFGIIFLVFIVILPSTFVAFDAAIPNTGKQKEDGTWTTLKEYMFGKDHRGAFGLGVGKERYWGNAFEWLSEQDTEINDPTQRPAFISWWDYGFYEVALGGHPTVADNFQDGIPTAANFHTATGERAGVVVLCVRLLEGVMFYNNGKLTEDVKTILKNRTGEENAEKIVLWMENPAQSPSYGKPIGAEYDEESSKDYTVGQQYTSNAYYQDIANLLTNDTIGPETNQSSGLTDEQITWLYHDLQEESGFSIRYYGVEGYDRQIFNIFGFLADKSLLLINGIADDFMELIYEGYTVDQHGNKISDNVWTAREIKDMSLEERRYIVVTGTSKNFKDDYFDTMFYRTYIGPPQISEGGSKTEFDWQIPCVDMKHFYAEYISDLSKYPYYDTGRAAVVIAKYYEGATLEGNVYFKGEPVNIPLQVAIQKPIYYTSDYSVPVTHDSFIIDGTAENNTGAFSLIAGAGGSLSLIRNLELENPTYNTEAYVIKEINFSGAEGSELAPITEDDAMRRPGSNYQRILNITIDPSNISGHVFDDIDNDGVYNESIDTPVKDANILFYEVLEFDTSEIQNQRLVPIPESTPLREIATSSENGSYNISGLMPGYYAINTYLDDILISQDIIQISSGNNTFDVTKPKKSAVNGIVYYDTNLNGEYDSSDEEINDATVELHYFSSFTSSDMIIDSMTTGADASYSFTDILPGQYTITASKSPDYEAEETLYIDENMTQSFNVSMQLSPVKVSGSTKFEGSSIGGITIGFDPDESYENNTAESTSATADESGIYEAELRPGFYNVTVGEIDGEILIYSFTGTLEVVRGDLEDIYDITLTKYTVTVSGYTTYGGVNIDNITLISFEPDETVANNTAYFARTFSSDETGMFTGELPPGSYVVKINYPFIEGAQNYTYTYEEKLTASSSDIVTGKTYNIAMSRVERE